VEVIVNEIGNSSVHDTSVENLRFRVAGLNSVDVSGSATQSEALGLAMPSVYRPLPWHSTQELALLGAEAPLGAMCLHFARTLSQGAMGIPLGFIDTTAPHADGGFKAFLRSSAGRTCGA